MKEITCIPKQEILCLTYIVTEEIKYYITTNGERTVYNLYQGTENGYIKIGRASDPIILEEKYITRKED